MGSGALRKTQVVAQVATAGAAADSKPLGRPKGRDSGETRDRIIQAARACLVEKGYGGTTLKDVAEGAGITRAAIYPYFASKPLLYAAVFEEAVSVLADVYQQAIELEGSLKDKLRLVLKAASDLHEQHADDTAILATIPIELRRHPELAELLVDGQNRFTELQNRLFEQAADSGEMPAKYQADDLLLTFIGGAMGMALMQYGSGIGSMSRSTELLLELID